MACQICFEESVPFAANWQIGGALCRRTCPARICAFCLAQHVQVTLSDCYTGILPVVRCPVCVTPMRMDRWLQPLRLTPPTADQARALHNEYYSLCQRACSLTTPCCHNVYYTHLPYVMIHEPRFENPLPLLPSKVAEYRKMVARFCGHRMDAQDVISFSLDNFGADVARELTERTLRRISDWERRARLMLAFLHMFPKTYTRCHRAAFCFRCKRAGHHDKCEDLGLAVVDPNKFIVRCRRCSVMITKDGGCDNVRCVCGVLMSWKRKVARYEEERASGGPPAPANTRLAERIVAQLKDHGVAWTRNYWSARARPV